MNGITKENNELMARPHGTDRDWLLELLNDPKSGFTQLYDDLRQLEQLGKSLRAFRKRGKVKNVFRRLRDWPGMVLPQTSARQEYQRFQRLESELHAKLEAFASAPRPFFDLVSGRWRVTEGWQEESPKEYLAVRYLIGLLAAGKLNRLRRCQNCCHWYVARIADQKCCGRKCRTKLSARDPKYKAKRALYMKKYRLNQSLMDRKIRKSAK